MHLEDVFNFVVTYAEGTSLSQSAFVSSMDYGSTAVHWAKVVRNLYVHYYKDVIKPYVMTGSIEIDESLFGRRVKYNRGNPLGQRVWVFGLVERQTNFLKLFPVERRDATTLTKIIRDNVAEGSTLYSDDWKAYILLPEAGYRHRIVQHKKAFAADYHDPATGEIERVHTNRIEGAWKHAKTYFRTMNGTSVSNFEAHLCEIMFRNRKRGNSLPATLQLITRHYPLTRPPSETFVPPIFDCWCKEDVPPGNDTVNRCDSSCDETQASDSSTHDEEERNEQSQDRCRHAQGKAQ
jgi:transposase-like protein